VAAESTSPTPNTYLGYPGAINNAINGAMANLFNADDFALNFWIGNEFAKPDGTLGYGVSPGLQVYLWNTIITDPREIMAFAARPRSFAVGAQSGVQGVIHGTELDLNDQFGFGDTELDHAGQFNRNSQLVSALYRQIGLRLGVIKPQAP
jgi:hypothetical protein